MFVGGDLDTAAERALGGPARRAAPTLPLVSVNALTLLGQIAWSNGEREEAQDWYRRAIATLTGIGADREAAQVWFEIGTLAAQAGLVAESADAFQRAAASTGLTARLPVVNPPASSPRTTPVHVPAGRARHRAAGRPAAAGASAVALSTRLTDPGSPANPHPPASGCGIIDVALAAAVEGW